MKAPVQIALLLVALQSASTMRVVPHSLVGQWKIGKPFHNAAQPIGLDANEENRLIGELLDIRSTSLSVCGNSVQIFSVDVATYSADAFLEATRVRVDQIGLMPPATYYTLMSRGLPVVCGSSHGFDIVADGHNAVLVVANDYFPLTRER